MDRRRFIGSVSGLAVVPMLPAMPAASVAVANPLSRGEPEFAKRYAEHLWREVSSHHDRWLRPKARRWG